MNKIQWNFEVCFSVSTTVKDKRGSISNTRSDCFCFFLFCFAMVLSRCRREGVCSPWKEYKNLLFCKSNLVMTKSLHYFIQLGSKRVISFLSQAHAHVTCDQTPLPLPPSLLPFVVGGGGWSPDPRLMLTRPHTFPKVTLIDQANFKIDIHEPV